MHDKKIIHKDLKPANVILSDDEINVKVIDFGLSKKIYETISGKGMQGTMKYMSPEQLSGTESFACDIWAFGCILMTLITGEEPFGNVDNFNACLKINKSQSPLDFFMEN